MGCCTVEAGIGGDVPARRQSVGMQDHQRFGVEGIGEFANARRDVPGGAVVRHHVPCTARMDKEGADVADADEADHPRRRVDPRDRHRGAACRRQRAMQRARQCPHMNRRHWRAKVWMAASAAAPPRRRGRSRQPAATSVRPGLAERPVVAADLLAGIGRQNGADQHAASGAAGGAGCAP